jgi:hypothetical protein
MRRWPCALGLFLAVGIVTAAESASRFQRVALDARFRSEGVAVAGPGADPAALWPIRVIAAPNDPRPGHGLGCGDVSGDGLLDFVTGKRFWAHTQGDSGIDEPARLCWFKLVRPAGGGRPTWTRQVIDENSGVGLHAQVVDVNLDGRPDVAISNKKGVTLFVQSP